MIRYVFLLHILGVRPYIRFSLAQKLHLTTSPSVPDFSSPLFPFLLSWLFLFHVFILHVSFEVITMIWYMTS